MKALYAKFQQAPHKPQIVVASLFLLVSSIGAIAAILTPHAKPVSACEQTVTYRPSKYESVRDIQRLNAETKQLINDLDCLREMNEAKRSQR